MSALRDTVDTYRQASTTKKSNCPEKKTDYENCASKKLLLTNIAPPTSGEQSNDAAKCRYGKGECSHAKCFDMLSVATLVQ